MKLKEKRNAELCYFDIFCNIYIISLLSLVSGISCDHDPEILLSCEGSEEDCTCARDDDCVLTQYDRDVASQEECYDALVCCPPPLHPLNKIAAIRNEQHFKEFGCIGDEGDCGEGVCSEKYKFWAECKENLCITMRQEK